MSFISVSQGVSVVTVPKQAQSSGRQAVWAKANWAEGDWYQLIASTNFDSLYLLLTLTQHATASALFDIGVGASESEIVKIADIFVSDTGQAGQKGITPICFPFGISAGSRIAIRGASENEENVMHLCCIVVLG